MSVENSIRKIRRSLGIRKCLIIDGNVGDVFLSRGKLMSLREILRELLLEMDFREIMYWDRIEGAVEEKPGSMSSLDTGTAVRESRKCLITSSSPEAFTRPYLPFHIASSDQ